MFAHLLYVRPLIPHAALITASQPDRQTDNHAASATALATASVVSRSRSSRRIRIHVASPAPAIAQTISSVKKAIHHFSRVPEMLLSFRVHLCAGLWLHSMCMHLYVCVCGFCRFGRSRHRTGQELALLWFICLISCHLKGNSQLLSQLRRWRNWHFLQSAYWKELRKSSMLHWYSN